MSAPMSTPISQLKNNANNTQPPKLDEDPMVQDVINSLVKEVKTPENIRSTPIGTFQQNIPQQGPYSQTGPPNPGPQQYYPMPYKQNNFLSQWINTDDVKTALILAFIALIIFYPSDTSAIYSKFEFLASFKQYDILLRTAVLACIFYILFNKFKHLI